MKKFLFALLTLSLSATLLPSHALAKGGQAYASPVEMNIFNTRVSYAQQHGQLIFRHGIRQRGSWVDIYSVPPAPGVPPYCITVVRSRGRGQPPLNITVLSSTAAGNAAGQVWCNGNLLAVNQGYLTRGNKGTNMVITINWQYGLTVNFTGGTQTVLIPPGYQ